ncbi:MAG: acyltransferase [Steroidobacteraceae bacterium]
MQKRIESVDSLRTIAIFGVIIGHNPNWYVFPMVVTFGIGQFLRFAVPFFFVVAGFFWAGKFNSRDEIGAATWPMAKRTALLFLVWSLVYLLPFHSEGNAHYEQWNALQITTDNFRYAISDPLRLLLEGGAAPLWFLSAQVMVLCICGLMLQRGLDRTLLILAIVLYLVGLAGHTYANTPLGIEGGFIYRRGPFAALLFFVTGYFLRKAESREHWLRWGLLLAVGGIALQSIEVIIIHFNFDGLSYPDYTIGTYPFGVGMAMMALSNWRLMAVPALVRVGPYVLGIYVSHVLFMDLLRPYYNPESTNAFYYLGYLLLVFGLSFGFSYLLCNSRLARPLVNLRRRMTTTPAPG